MTGSLGGQRHFHFCTFGAVCKDAWDRQHLTASYYKLLEGISCWIDAWDSQHHTEFLLCITAMVAWWICDIGTFVGAFEPSSTWSRARGRMDIIIEEFSRRRLCDQKCLLACFCLLGRWWQRVTNLRVLRRRGVWVEVSTLASGCFQKCWISDLESSLCFGTLRNSRRELKHKQKRE